MIRKYSKILFYGVIFLTLMNSCQSTDNRNKEEKDFLNKEEPIAKHNSVKISSKIVVLDIGALETLNELGVKPIGVPKKFMPNYLDNIKNDANVADVGSVIEPDFEAISALSPDLILISTRQERFYNELKEIAQTINIGVDTKDFVSSFKKNTRLIAEIVGKREQVAEKLDSLEGKIEQARTKFHKNPNKAMFLIYNNGKYSAFGKGSRFGFIHDVLGIKPVMDLKDESVHGQRVSNEFIVEANPDYLFIVDRNAAVLSKKTTKGEMENLLIQQTKAFKNNNIFYLDPNVWFISGGGLKSVNLMIDDVLKLIP